MMEALLQDLRFALRTLLRARGFTAAAVVTLGVGIGATTLIFSLVNAVLLRPFPFRDPGSLVWVTETDHAQGRTRISSSYPTYLDWRAQTRSFSGVAAVRESSASLRTAAGAERLSAAVVSANLFRVLGIRPLHGRDFLPAEEGVGAPRAVLLSHRTWQQQFGGASDVIGRIIYVDTEPRTIVGIMPPGFQFPERAELWLPLALDAVADRGMHQLTVVARLKPGVSMDAADAELATLSARFGAQYPESNADMVASVRGLHAGTVADIRPVLLILLGAVGFVLLIACANVANLLLARAATRDREIAIRGALGAERGRILRLLLTEALMLSAGGAALGVLFASWWLELLVRSLPAQMPYWLHFGLDARVLAFAAAVACGTALLCGLAPALQSLRGDQQRALRERGRSLTASRGSARLRGGFVVAQLVGAIVLLTGALLMIKSFLAMQAVDPGFTRSGLVVMQLAAPTVRYDNAERITGFYRRVLERARALPGVQDAALTSWFPVSGDTRRSNFSIAGVGEIQDVSAFNHVVSPGYFRTMGIVLRRGRDFTAADRAASPAVAIINQRIADHWFPGQDPVGRQIKFGGGGGEFATIIGVAADAHQNDVNQREIGPEIYVPHAQAVRAEPAMVSMAGGASQMTLVLRARPGSEGALYDAMRRELRALDSDVPLYTVRTVEEVLAEATWDSRLFGTLFFLFALGALLLAGIGLYAVMAFATVQRRQEIGVRIALGATRTGVVRLILGQGARLLGLGVLAGVVLAFALARVLETLLFGVHANDPSTYLLVPLVLAAVALLACWLPARRASRLDPVVALRAD